MPPISLKRKILESTNKKIRVIDMRNKQKFQTDDAYYDSYAKICGIYATGVYMALCRHADIDQYCFPSIKMMAEKLDVSEDSVSRGIKELKKNNIISVEKCRSRQGVWKNNSYILLDKSVWKPNINLTPQGKTDNHTVVSGEPYRCQQVDHDALGGNKDTHIEGNTCKETHISINRYMHKPMHVSDKGINDVINHLKKGLGVSSLKEGEGWERRYAKHLICKITKLYDGDEDIAVKNIKLVIDSALESPFHSQYLNGFRYLFNHCGKIFNEYGQFEEPFIIDLTTES